MIQEYSAVSLDSYGYVEANYIGVGLKMKRALGVIKILYKETICQSIKVKYQR